MKRYLVNEIFFSIQGEGVRAGTAAAFIRFSKCNLRCCDETVGWQCDTDFESGEWYTAGDLVGMLEQWPPCWVILTGGEPSLQADRELVQRLQEQGWKVAMETNGTRSVEELGLDWITVSPKTPWLHQHYADEAKYVMTAEAPLPDTSGLQAQHWLVSPAFKGDEIDPLAMERCIEIVTGNPAWRLSCQQHKWWGVR